MKKLFGLVCCLSASTAFAQADVKQQQLIKKSTIHASITVGYGGIENPVLDADDVTSPILPSFAYYGDNWYFDDFSLGYSLYETENFYVDLLGRFNDDGFFFELDGVDKLYATGVVRSSSGRPTLPTASPINLTPIERDLSYMAGLSSAVNVFDGMWLSAAYVHDVTNVHNGYEILLNGYHVFELFSGTAGIEAGINYKNEELIDYYYTVSPSESKTRLLSYNLESATNYYLKVSYEFPISDSFTLDFKLKHTWLDSNLANSHMINKNGYFSGFTGITYHF
jgi:MipA family protein